ncbi:MAG: methyltransferase family protein [Xanthobacteraceae bacterium]
MRKPLLPPVYFLAGICGMLALHFLLPVHQVLLFPWTLAGIIPAIIGATLNLLADRAFKRHRTTVKPFEVPTSLMTDGVFALSRNPMYLGMVLILFGLALFLGTLSPFLICVGFAILVDYRFIRVEERMLADQFGTEWRAYSSRVRRWI